MLLQCFYQLLRSVVSSRSAVCIHGNINEVLIGIIENDLAVTVMLTIICNYTSIVPKLF